MQIRRAAASDSRALANLHLACSAELPDRLENQLGPGYLASYYRVFLSEPQSLILCTELDDQRLAGAGVYWQPPSPPSPGSPIYSKGSVTCSASRGSPGSTKPAPLQPTLPSGAGGRKPNRPVAGLFCSRPGSPQPAFVAPGAPFSMSTSAIPGRSPFTAPWAPGLRSRNSAMAASNVLSRMTWMKPRLIAPLVNL